MEISLLCRKRTDSVLWVCETCLAGGVRALLCCGGAYRRPDCLQTAQLSEGSCSLDSFYCIRKCLNFELINTVIVVVISQSPSSSSSSSSSTNILKKPPSPPPPLSADMWLSLSWGIHLTSVVMQWNGRKRFSIFHSSSRDLFRYFKHNFSSHWLP